MTHKRLSLTLTKKITFMSRQYANKNWRAWVRDEQTQEEEIDRSITPDELKYLLDKALDWTGKDLSLTSIKLKFKLIIKNKPNINE